MRFTTLNEIKSMRVDIMAYVKEAIKIEKADTRFIPEKNKIMRFQ